MLLHIKKVTLFTFLFAFKIIRSLQCVLKKKKKMRGKMEKRDNELRTKLANLNQVMPNIGSSIQQSVGILVQLLLDQ